MISSIFILSLTRPVPFNMPIHIKNNFNKKINAKIASTSLKEKNTGWEKINNYDKILNKYFDNYKNIYSSENRYAEIFKIDGVPAAAAIIEYDFKKNLIIEFVLNKNLILMFDAGPVMRKTFYYKYKFKIIQYNNALHKIEFLII